MNKSANKSLAQKISDLEKKIEQLEFEKKQLLEEKKTDEDKLLLEIIRNEHFPFTLWICNSDFSVVYWNDICENVYGLKRSVTIGKKYSNLFVAEEHRWQSEKDCKDTIEVDKSFKNCYAKDEVNGKTIELLTNCFRIIHPITNQALQVELGLDVSDFKEKQEEYVEVVKKGARRLEKSKTDTLSLFILSVFIPALEKIISSLEERIKKCEIILSKKSDEIYYKEIESKRKIIEDKISNIKNNREKFITDLRKGDADTSINQLQDYLAELSQELSNEELKC